jgi:hypothetical protein
MLTIGQDLTPMPAKRILIDGKAESQPNPPKKWRFSGTNGGVR